MVGGIGDYNIECTPGVRNIISFEQLSRDFNLDLDLSDERKQNFYFHHPSGFYSGKVMSITQKGINSVVGTKQGYDKIRGNNLDNTFSLGNGGGLYILVEEAIHILFLLHYSIICIYIYQKNQMVTILF